ncbi:DNA replication terminus site-binding protein [Pseudomonas sp. LB3P38]|jgi:hypothetical protein|uniref:DNA replication terminus site-binding protein n=1 Tax=Pseudomonas lyxosi TaxID=3398358 RepID=UPI0039EE19DD
MEITFDAYGDCVYRAIMMQKNLHDLRGVLLDDPSLEINILWKVPPQKFGTNVIAQRLFDGVAGSALLEAMSNFSGEEAWARKRPIRFPGLVRVSPETFRIVKEVCESKYQLRASLNALSKSQRQKFWSKFPTWTGIEVRRFPILIESAKAIRFYWFLNSSLKKMSATNWAAKIRQQIANEFKISSAIRDRLIELRRRELAYFETVNPDLVVGEFRTTRPSIKGRVVFQDGSARIYNASLPFIFCDDVSDIVINPLKDLYDYCPPGHARNAHHVRAKLMVDPITPGSNFYCYQSRYQSDFADPMKF